MVGERITKPSRRRGLLAVLGGLCFAKSVDGFWLGAAPGRVWDGPGSRPLCPAVSGATWAQSRPVFSAEASPAGLQSACYAKKRGSPEGERAQKGGRGRKKEEEVVRDHDDDEEVLEFGAYERDLDFDDGADYDDGNDEGYVFDPSDFPMLDGEEDLFGDYEDEEEGAAVEKLRRAEEEGKGEGQEATRKRKAKLPVLAVIGRPNVGKSTIVNRICKTLSNEPKAIVYDYEGVTRDRIYRRAEWDERLFEVVDTGGLIFDENAEDVFAPQIREQALLALDESVASIFVVDGQTGPTTLDEEIARFLRMRKKPVIVAVNKCENPTMAEAWASMFYSLGLGKPFAVSGLHGTGIAEVLEKLKPHIYQVDEVDDDTAFNVAIVGRPNVGKSSLLNRLYGKERAIVSDVAGTTRDAIDAMVTHEGQEYRFIDTAGIRRRKKVEHGNEFLMVNRALKAIRRADVVLLVIDVVAGISDQDKILAQRIADDGRACVIIANKWDAVEKDEKTFNEAVKYVKEELYAVNWAEVIFTSALTGQRVNKIYDAVNRAVRTHRQRVRTSLLNEVLSDALMWQKPPAVKASQIGRIYYCNQVSVEPPTMVVFCNNPKLFPESYKRYLDRKFRESLDFKGTPIRWNFRGKKMRQINRGQPKSTPVPYGSP